MTHSLQAAILPETGHRLYSADFQQMELRVLAQMAKDEVLLNALISGLDLHREIASRIFQVAPADVTKEQRSIAKAAVFGAIYGQTPYGLAQTFRLEEEAAEAIQASLWKILKGCRKFINDTIDMVRTSKQVASFHGRVRDLREAYRADQAYAERLGVNHRIQTTAGDLMRIGLINLAKKLAPIGGKVILTRHDEILFSVPATVPASEVRALAVTAMVTENETEFPLSISVKVGDRWSNEMTEVA